MAGVTALVIAALALACFMLGVACAVLAWLVRQLHADLDMFTRPFIKIIKRDAPELPPPWAEPGA